MFFRVVFYNIPNMSNIIYHMAPWRKHMKRLGLSERAASISAKVSRGTWRVITERKATVELKSAAAAAHALGVQLILLLTHQEACSDFSTVAVSFRVLQDGVQSWKIHFMNFVDEFRRTWDPRLILLPPPSELPLKLKGLLAAIVLTLGEEAGIDSPEWARKRYDLEKPWFVSETESLKATALLESPLHFRRNGIFVGANFLERV